MPKAKRKRYGGGDALSILERQRKRAKKAIKTPNTAETCYAKSDGGANTKWTVEAARLGHPKAQAILGSWYADGSRFKKDEKKANDLYKKSADQGCLWSKVELGIAYEEGIGCEKDLKQAISLYSYALEKDDKNATALDRLGHCYMHGTGVEKDEKKGLDYYERAANEGSVCSMLSLAHYYRDHGILDKAVEWFMKLGDGEAHFELGSISYDQGNKTKAVEYWTQGAVLNDPICMCNLAQSYEEGDGLQKDPALARYWYEKAAKLGDGPAQVSFVFCCVRPVFSGQDSRFRR